MILKEENDRMYLAYLVCVKTYAAYAVRLYENTAFVPDEYQKL